MLSSVCNWRLFSHFWHLAEGKSRRGRVFSAHQELEETREKTSRSFIFTGRKKTISSPASGADGGSQPCLPLQPPTHLLMWAGRSHLWVNVSGQ